MKLKVMEGEAAIDDIKMCTLSNVVCNGHMVFNFLPYWPKTSSYGEEGKV